MPILTGTIDDVTGSPIIDVPSVRVTVRAPSRRSSLAEQARLVASVPVPVEVSPTGEISVELEPGPAVLLVEGEGLRDVYELGVTEDMTLLTEALQETSPTRSWVESQMVQLRSQTVTAADDALEAAIATGQDRAEIELLRQNLIDAANENAAPHLTEAALSATYALKGESGGSGPSLAPFYVSTYELMKATPAPTGVRAGLSSAMVTSVSGDGVTSAQGYVEEHVVTGVSGMAGSYSLAVADIETLTTLVGGTSTAWQAVVTDGVTGRAFPVAVLSVSGGTVNVAQPLPHSVASGTLSSWMDAVLGQHLTRAATRALAQHVAAANPLVATRGGILDGQWDTLPPQHRQPWVRNAALTAYGTSNSASPVVQSALLAENPSNNHDVNYVAKRLSYDPGGTQIGTHQAGHGATATLRIGRRPAVVELHLSANRGADTLTAARVRVTVTAPDGSVLYDRTVAGSLTTHRIPVTGVDSVTVEVTNTDGGIYYIWANTLTVREAGTAPILRPQKALLFGDSWTQFYDHLLGDELAEALGSEVVTFGKGGTTTDWGIAWLETALDQNPDVDTVILHFYTNDTNNNQGQTFTAPDGSTQPMWPTGLTGHQAVDRWARQINRLVSMCQLRGVRPVVIGPGSVGITGQFRAALRMETPPLVEWRAAAAELADPAAFVNRVGKEAGAKVTVGASTRTASGPAPSDPWVDVNADALVGLQRASLSLSSYRLDAVEIGTDTNADGLSDGLSAQLWSDTSQDTFTPSIVEGRQRITAVYGATGSGSVRYGAEVPVQAGREYMAVGRITNAPPSQSFGTGAVTLSGATELWGWGDSTGRSASTVDASGQGTVFFRATATANGTRYARVGIARQNSTTVAYDIERFTIVDLTALFETAPNLRAITNAELAAFLLAMT